MSQSEKQKAQTNGGSLDTEISQTSVGQDLLTDPILLKKSNEVILVGTEQTASSDQPEDSGKNEQDEPTRDVGWTNTVVQKKDTHEKTKNHGSVNSVFRGLRTVYEQYNDQSKGE